MQTNTPNLPEWAENMVEPVAWKINVQFNAMDCGGCVELTREEVEKLATAALAEALPMVARHMSEAPRGRVHLDKVFQEARQNFINDATGSSLEEHMLRVTLEHAATAIRREVRK